MVRVKREPIDRKAILERDNHECQKCGCKDILEIHHMTAVTYGSTGRGGIMYTLVTSPTTGEKFYVNMGIMYRERVFDDEKRLKEYVISNLFMKEAVTEDELADSILESLQGYEVLDEEHLKHVLKQYFDIHTDTCPELVRIVQQGIGCMVN